MNYTPTLPDDTVNVSQTNPLATAAKLMVSLLLIGVVIYFVLATAIDYAVDAVTPEQEQQLNSFFHADMNLSDENDTYVQKVADKLAVCAKLPYPIQVHVAEEQEPNAFAVPGGTIYITSGILAKMQSENELAFILGHEMGHFKHKDHLRSLGIRLILGVLGMALGSDYGMAGNMTIGIGSARYSQFAELAADAYGLEVMQCAYGTVSDATRMFEKMDEGNEWRYFLATHPGFKTRITHMKALIQTQSYDTTQKPLPFGTKVYNPNPEIEIHDSVPSSYPWASHKTIAEPLGATQILHKAHEYEHNTDSKNSISRFGYNAAAIVTDR